MPLFRDELGTSSAVAGLHSLMLAAGIVIAGFAGVSLARRWQRSGAASRGVAVMTIAVLLFTAGSLLTGAELVITLPAMLVIGLGGGLALNISTTVLQEHNGAYGPAMISLGNAAAAGVGLVTRVPRHHRWHHGQFQRQFEWGELEGRGHALRDAGRHTGDEGGA